MRGVEGAALLSAHRLLGDSWQATRTPHAATTHSLARENTSHRRCDRAAEGTVRWAGPVRVSSSQVFRAHYVV